MTPEERMIHKVISQILADNGINRDTIQELIKEVIGEKVNKAIEACTRKYEIHDQIRHVLRGSIENVAKETFRDALRDSRPLMKISVEMQDGHGQKPGGENGG